MNPINNLLEKLIDRLMPSDEGLPYDEVHAPLDQIEEATLSGRFSNDKLLWMSARRRSRSPLW